MFLRRTLKRIGIGATALVVVLLLIVAVSATLLDWNMLRGFISRQVSAAIGRDFAINGDLDVRFSWTPTIRAEQLALANAQWSGSRRMADIEILELRIDLGRLVRGELAIPEITVVQPTLLLERSKDGQANWHFGQQDGKARGGEPPEIGRLNIRGGVVFYRDPANDAFVRMDISTRPSASESDEGLLAFDGTGRFRGQKLAVRGSAGTLLSLRSPGNPYPVDIEARVGQTRVAVRGTLHDPLRLAGMDIDLRLEGQDLGKLGDITRLPLPGTPPYTLIGHVNHTGQTWRLSDLRGTLGDSRITGDIVAELAGERPMFRGELVAALLDLDDLATLLGAAPETDAGETASAEQKQKAAQAQRKPRILPDTPYHLARLRNADADVKFRAARVRGEAIDVERLAGHLVLRNGKLKIDPLNFEVADGSVVSDVTVDAGKDTPATAADITIRNVDLHELFPEIEVTKEILTRFGGRATLASRGNSLAAMAAGLDGEVSFVMSGGRVSNLLLELAGIDGGEALRFFLGGDEEVPMRCTLVEFKITNGVMNAKTFVIDTTDTNILGEGRIDLGQETLDLTFRPQPKDPSIFSSRAPLYVTGTMKEPGFEVDKTTIAGRVGAAVALGVLVNPLAALIPLIETGPGEDANCAALFAHAGSAPDPKTKSFR